MCLGHPHLQYPLNELLSIVLSKGLQEANDLLLDGVDVGIQVLVKVGLVLLNHLVN